MPRNKSNKQNNLNYQSLRLCISFFTSMISLGIVIWNRPSVIPSNARNLLGNSPIIPAQAGIQASSSEFLDSRFYGNDYSTSYVSTYKINFPSFSSSLILSALTYQQTQNTFASVLTLLWPSVTGLQFYKRQLGQEFRVNTYTLGQQIVPRTASLNSAEEFIITWQSFGQDGSGWGVYAQRYANNGTLLGKEFQINSFTIDEQSQAWGVTLDQNSFVIAWQSFNQDGSDFGIYMKLYANNGSALTEEIPVNIYTQSKQGYPSISSNDLDEILILWGSYGQDGSDYSVYGRYYFNNGIAITDEFQINMYTNDDQSQASAAAIRNNQWVAAWHSNGQDGSSYGIYANIFINNTIPIGPEFRINQYTLDAQMAPAVIHFENDFIVLFVSQEPQPGGNIYGNTFAVYARHFADNGTALSDEYRVSFDALSPWHKISAAVLNPNYYIVVWKAVNNASSDLDVYVRVCERDSNCTNPEFRINSFASVSSASATGEAVAILSNTSFVVTYDGNGADDNDGGVYARIITLDELNITFPTPSPTLGTTPSPTIMPTSVSESVILSNTLETTVTKTNSKLSLSSSNSMVSSNSVTNNNNTAVSNESNSNIGAYVGGAVAGGVVLVGLVAAGFFVCRNKSGKNKVENVPEKETEISLKNLQTTTTPISNYARIDEIKKPENQYDTPMKLEI
jgi:hypothetical protein